MGNIYVCTHTHTHTHNGVLFSHKKWYLTICNDIDGAREHNNAKWNKSEKDNYLKKPYNLIRNGERILRALFFFLRFYLFIHENKWVRQRHRQREKQAPHEEPDAGLDPGTQRSWPETKADSTTEPPRCPWRAPLELIKYVMSSLHDPSCSCGGGNRWHWALAYSLSPAPLPPQPAACPNPQAVLLVPLK